VDAARSRQTGGTGLGLSIVKHVISNHGGEVTLWSRLGQGSTFTIRLPEIEGQDDGDAPEAGKPAAQKPSRDLRPQRRDAAGVHEQGATA
jgi:two-component system sensor histidine kinase SenX3